MEKEIPGGFVLVETDPTKVGTSTGPTHLTTPPTLPARIVDHPPEDDDDPDLVEVDDER